MQITNNLIVGITGVTLLLLIGSGVRKPELFENQSYSNIVSLLVGGLLGVVSTQNPPSKKDEDDYNIR